METQLQETDTRFKNETKTWDDAELAFLIDNMQEDPQWLSELFYRTPDAIIAMKNRMLSGDLQHLLTADDKTKLGKLLASANENTFEPVKKENPVVQESDKIVNSENFPESLIVSSENNDTSAPLIINEVETINEEKAKHTTGYTSKRWSEKELQFCIDNEKKGMEWLGKQTNRTPQSIYTVFWRLNHGDLRHYLNPALKDKNSMVLPYDHPTGNKVIHGDMHHKAWTDEEIYFIYQRMNTLTARQLEKTGFFKGRTVPAIAVKVSQLGAGVYNDVIEKMKNKQPVVEIKKPVEKKVESKKPVEKQTQKQAEEKHELKFRIKEVVNGNGQSVFYPQVCSIKTITKGALWWKKQVEVEEWLGILYSGEKDKYLLVVESAGTDEETKQGATLICRQYKKQAEQELAEKRTQQTKQIVYEEIKI